LGFAFRWRNPYLRTLRTPCVCDNRCRRRPCLIDAIIGYPTTSVGAGLRLPGSRRVIRRGRFSLATSRARAGSILRGLAGRRSSSLLPPGGAHGVAPFAGLLPVRVDARGKPRGQMEWRASLRVIPFSEHFCSSGPTCLLIDRVRAPIFFVGVIVRLRGYNRSERRSTRTLSHRSGFWASLPRPIRFAGDHVRSRRSFLPWALPLAGLSATPRYLARYPGCACSRSGSSPLRVTSLRRRVSRSAYPLVGFGRPSRATDHFKRAAAEMTFRLPGLLNGPGSRACPSAY